jgi:AraC family transcriptional regulator, transcriptional activator of pobA
MVKNRLPVYSIREFGPLPEKRDFYANTMADHLLHHHFVQTPHKHDFYLTVLFTKGHGKHEIDFSIYNVKPGSVFFLSPGQMHNWVLSGDIDGYIFFHTKDFYDLTFNDRSIHDLPFFYSIYNSPVVYLKPSVKETVQFLFSEITTEYGGSRPMKMARLSSLVDLTYIELARSFLPGRKDEGTNSGYMLKLRKLEELIDKHFKEERSPGAYASMMNMTGKHLNRICKTCLDKTVSDMIADRVVLEAKRMLVHSGWTVAQVADELGIFDHSYFARMFKKHTGETPLEFASRYR